MGVGIEVSDGRGDKEIVANTNDQGNGTLAGRATSIYANLWPWVPL